MTAAWWSQHGVHVLLLALPTLVIGGIGLRADLQARRDNHPRDDHRGRPSIFTPIRLAAALSFAAAVIHSTVCPEHFKEATLYGVFFLIVASAQLVWAVVAWRRAPRWWLVAGAFGNGAIVALWAVTRTIGIPLGPGRGEVETVGALDIVATTCEVLLVGCLVVALVTPVLRRARLTA